MNYTFLVETYASERLKTLNVWSMFADEDLDRRPHPLLERDRTPREQMVHQCLSEDKWFRGMFGIETGAPPLPEQETRLNLIQQYARDSGIRLARLQAQENAWWEEEVAFFDTVHSRAWIMVRRVAHTAHHRGEQTTLLRLLGRAVHSVYGPSVDTGGLPANQASTIYAYSDIDALLAGEAQGGKKAPLPGPGWLPSTERPELTVRTALAFNACSLPKTEWTHEAHLRVGLWHLLHYTPTESLDRLRAGISRYNLACGVANTDHSGYHESITRFYVWLIDRFLHEVDKTRPLDALAAELIERYGDRQLPFQYWNKPRLQSAAARLGWVEPDIQPLENYHVA